MCLDAPLKITFMNWNYLVSQIKEIILRPFYILGVQLLNFIFLIVQCNVKCTFAFFALLSKSNLAFHASLELISVGLLNNVQFFHRWICILSRREWRDDTVRTYSKLRHNCSQTW